MCEVREELRTRDGFALEVAVDELPSQDAREGLHVPPMKGIEPFVLDRHYSGAGPLACRGRHAGRWLGLQYHLIPV